MNSIRRHRALKKSGFTLIEILLVLVIIAVVAGLVVVNIQGSTLQAYRNTAKIQVNSLRNFVNTYFLAVGSYPSDLNALYEPPSDLANPGDWTRVVDSPVSKDPWGHDYTIEISGSDFVIRCAGPDGQYNTEDDIYK